MGTKNTPALPAFLLLSLLSILVLSLLATAAVAEPSSLPTYQFTIYPSGEAVVVISNIVGETTFLLPPDVLTPDIVHGKYVNNEKGITVLPNPTEPAKLQYTSAHYTTKEEGLWYFEAAIANNSVVEIILPEQVKVVQARPRPTITKDTTLTMAWDRVPEKIAFSYVFMGEETGDQPVSNQSFSIAIITIGGIVFLLAAVYVMKKYKKRKGVQPQQSFPASIASSSKTVEKTAEEATISDGQMNLLRAANENEALVLRILLRHQGHMKRNALEKETELSRSSLASSLHNLEKKKILSIDRTFHTHYITLTQWFKGL